jgi:hypothetical protein
MSQYIYIYSRKIWKCSQISAQGVMCANAGCTCSGSWKLRSHENGDELKMRVEVQSLVDVIGFQIITQSWKEYHKFESDPTALWNEIHIFWTGLGICREELFECQSNLGFRKGNWPGAFSECLRCLNELDTLTIRSTFPSALSSLARIFCIPCPENITTNSKKKLACRPFFFFFGGEGVHSLRKLPECAYADHRACRPIRLFAWTTRLMVKWLSWNMTLGSFTKISQNIQILAKTGQK